MKRLSLLVLSLCFATAAAAQEGGQIEAVLFPIPDAPVELDNYSAGVGGPRGQAETIVHSIRFTSREPNEIHAVQVGFLSFDIMGQMMDNHVETYVRSGRPQPQVVLGYIMDVHHRTSFASSIAYVRAVRFSDGRVWKADLGGLVARAKQFDRNVSLDWVQRF